MRLHLNHDAARFAVLKHMGLAESTAPHTWYVRYDVEEVLRAMQRASDRQKTLAAHGIPMSDERLRIEILDMRQLTAVEGRILVHGQDEQSGRNYLILEGTDAKAHFIHPLHTGNGRGPQPRWAADEPFCTAPKTLSGWPADLGHSRSRRCRKAAEHRRLLEQNACALLKRGAIPTEDGWGGWLGRYQAALASAANEIVHNRELRPAPSPERRRDRSRGR